MITAPKNTLVIYIYMDSRNVVDYGPDHGDRGCTGDRQEEEKV